MRTMVLLAHHILRLEIIHPSAATLTIPRMEIRIINGEVLSFLIKYLVSCHFGVIDLDVLILFEFEAIQFLCEPKDTFLHAL